MGIFKDRTTYLKGLATANRLIDHDGAIGQKKRKTFFKINSEEELLTACVNWIHFPCMSYTGCSGRYTSNDSGVGKRVLSSELLFLAKANPMDFQSVEDAYDITFTAMEEIIGRILNDFEEQGSCSPFSNLDLSRFSFEEVGPIADTLYGWTLRFSDEKFAQDVITYDPSKWK